MNDHVRLARRLTWVAVLFCFALLMIGAVSITVAAANDNNVEWNGLAHNSRDTLYRTPGGAVPTNTVVKLRLRAFLNDLTAAQIRIWNDRANTQQFVDLTRVAADDTYEYWEYSLNTGALPTVYYYRFIAKDGSATAYYQDNDQFGGFGDPSATANDFRSWQLTVYDPTFQTPDWVKNAVIYQIFTDRFRDGSSANNTPAGTFFYNEAGGTIYRSVTTDWNTVVCDPRQATGAPGCPVSYSRNFYGGDLQGVIDKLDYLQDLGVTAIYFNPIFESPSNHKYDTTDFKEIDDNFGDLVLFQTLATQAKSRGIRLILDGVFNHSSSDSHYFDRYNRYNDFLGACEDVNSPYRSWYYFQNNAAGVCAGPANYESWFGYDSLPKLRANNAAVRALIWSDGINSVGPYWMQWADGWRLDVGGDVDPGTANDPSNDYWEGFRDAVRATNPDTYIVGEEWGNGTSWLLGQEWDATMNYQFSSIMLSFWRDTKFVDNDHNSGSSAGELNPITPTVANERLLNWQERYPQETVYAQMNLLGSHDTSRPLFMLEHGLPNSPAEGTIFPNTPTYNWSNAINRLKGVVLMQMTLPGAPTIYYGDEVGLVGPQTWAGGKWEDDPYNRQPFPWLDQSGTPYFTHLQSEAAGSPRAQLLDYYKLLTNARNSHAALRTGSYDLLLAQNTPNAFLVYGRRLADASDAAVVFLNRSNSTQLITVNVSGYIPIGSTFDNVLTPANDNYVVQPNGNLSADSIPAQGGALLVMTSAPSPLPSAVTLNGTSGVSQANLTWGAAANAVSYDVYRSVVSGGGYTFVANTANTNYTDSGLSNGKKYYYVVISRSSTQLKSVQSNEITITPQYDLVAASKILQFPFTITHTISTTTPTPLVYGQLYIAGATDVQNTVVAGIRAQVGFGANGSTPNHTWTWSEMVPNPSYNFGNNNDEYQGSMLPSAIGEYDYTVRFSGNNGETWHYATVRNGGGSPIGDMTVNASSDTNAPSAPSNLTVTSRTSSSISLGWSASTDTRMGGRAMDSYRVYRDVSPGDVFTLIGTVDDAVLTYTDTTVVTGTTYDYYVTAVDDSFNESAPSNTVTTTAENVLINVTFVTTVPATTPDETIYIVGNQNIWGPWNPNLTSMTETAPGVWEWTGQFLTGTAVTYKHTRGNWDKVEKQADGFGEIEYSFQVADEGGGEQTRSVTIQNWRDIYVVSHTPADDAANVDPASTITATFNKDIDFNAGTFNTKFQITGPGATPVAGAYMWNGDTNTVTFTPTNALADGEYTVNVSGVTVGSDNQYIPTMFNFTVGAGGTTPTELLVNGDFELDTDANTVPDNWTGANLVRDRIRCNTAAKTFSYNGECAFQTKGSAAERSRLTQTVDLSQFTFEAGETLTFSGYVNAKSVVNAKIRLDARYTNGTQTTKTNITIAPGSGTYVLVTGELVLAEGSANLDRIRVQIRNNSPSGRIRFDTFSLLQNAPAGFGASVGGGTIPLPGQ